MPYVTPKEQDIADRVIEELSRARDKFPRRIINGHEGYAIIKEELDELWDEVKADNKELALKEAVQVAAMAIRFIVDLEGYE